MAKTVVKEEEVDEGLPAQNGRGSPTASQKSASDIRDFSLGASDRKTLKFRSSDGVLFHVNRNQLLA